jgi:hypothetical protein
VGSEMVTVGARMRYQDGSCRPGLVSLGAEGDWLLSSGKAIGWVSPSASASAYEDLTTHLSLLYRYVLQMFLRYVIRSLQMVEYMA